ncbi:hypothetical protein L596_020150 [Steinernema carpocapsae]|uniref:Uncharacterized protein n=1 Tax=Steinernema carpocapsae TaxID=34508 RepID=A0A4U5MST2_STECR|nr:hypothetical protein L596_020150 [Steinernema carpocapsae]
MNSAPAKGFSSSPPFSSSPASCVQLICINAIRESLCYTSHSNRVRRQVRLLAWKSMELVDYNCASATVSKIMTRVLTDLSSSIVRGPASLLFPKEARVWVAWRNPDEVSWESGCGGKRGEG